MGNEEKVEKKSILFYRKWNKEKATVIRKVTDYLDEIEYENIDSNTNIELNKRFESKDKELIRKLFQENRNELLMEILRPFETGNDGINTTHLKLDLLKETNDERFTMKNIEGYIYDYIQKDDHLEIKFRITNDRMRKFDKLFLMSNFIKPDNDNKYTHIQKWNVDKPFNLDNDQVNIIDLIYYPYEYLFETRIPIDEAEKWLKRDEETDQLYVDNNACYGFDIRDLGLPQKADSNQKEQEGDNTFEASIEALKRAVESRDIDKINACLKKTNNSVEKITLSNTVERLKNKSNTNNEFGVGNIEFIDDSSVHNVSFEAFAGNSNPIDIIVSSTSAKNQLSDLFDDYLKAEIDIYKVSLGNCIVMDITYNKKGKKNNLLIFDAGVNTSNYFKEECKKVNNCSPETIIEKTADTLKKRITDFQNEEDKNGEVYFMVSHYHPDHNNIFDELLFKNNQTDNTPVKINCIMHTLRETDEYALRQCMYLYAFAGGKMSITTNSDVLYSKGGIKVLQGKVDSQSKSKYAQENQRSLMVQLKNTLLPADSYYRDWHDEFGKIYRLNDKKESELNYKKFEHIFAPHHGWINDSKYDWIKDASGNETADIKSKSLVKGIYEKDHTHVYVLRHDDGKTQTNNPTTPDMMQSLGISTDPRRYHITKYNAKKPCYSFSDQWDFTTMSDEEIVDECIWALKNTPRADEKINDYLNNQHQHCTCGYGIADAEIDHNDFINWFKVYFNNKAIDDSKDITYYFNYAIYYNTKCNYLNCYGCNNLTEFIFKPDTRNLAKSKIEFYTNSIEKATNIYQIFYELIRGKEPPYNNCTLNTQSDNDISKPIEVEFYSDEKGINLNHSYNAVEITENNSIYTIKIRLVQNWSDAYQRSTP